MKTLVAIFFKSLVTASIILAYTLSSWAGTGYLLPPLNSDENKLAFLFEVRKQVPALFSEAAQYDIDLFTLLDNERELVQLLKANPEYDQLFSSKKYFDLVVSPPAEGIPVGSIQIQPEAIEAWKNGLKIIADEYRSKTISPEDLIHQVRMLVQPNQLQHIQDASQLLGTLGKLDRNNASKAELDRQKESQKILNQCLRKSDLLSKYDCIEERFEELSSLPSFGYKVGVIQTETILVQDLAPGFTREKLSRIREALRAEKEQSRILNLLAVIHRPQAQA